MQKTLLTTNSIHCVGKMQQWKERFWSHSSLKVSGKHSVILLSLCRLSVGDRTHAVLEVLSKDTLKMLNAVAVSQSVALVRVNLQGVVGLCHHETVNELCSMLKVDLCCKTLAPPKQSMKFK